MNENELYHYGVVGMRWGVRKAQRKIRANERLQKKALSYDRKSALMTKRSEKAHAEIDLGESNRRAIKAAKYDKKAAAVSKKAIKTESDFRRTRLEKKSENLKYKAAKARIKSNRISKSTGYGSKAMKYSVKSDKAAAKAAKARREIAKNQHYETMMKRKISSLSDEELRGAYSFVSELMKE